MRFSLPCWVAFLVIGLAASAAHAESVVWNSILRSLTYTYPAEVVLASRTDGNYEITQTLLNPNVSVHYTVSVWESDVNGAKIRRLASNATIPQGTYVLYEFKPHDYTDITWNGTGGVSDTP
jgi:hypothetical protein